MANGENARAVQRMQEYITANLNQPISLLDLSRAAGYSPWHSSRIFKEQTGWTPFDYIRQLRLSQAATRLRDEPDRIVDVALDFVFDSHEGFTRAFTRAFGVSPQAFRIAEQPVRLFISSRTSSDYLTIKGGEVSMNEKIKPSTIFVQVIERPARKMIIRRGVKASDYYEFCEEVGCEIWDVLTGIKEALYEPIGMWLPPAMVKPGTSVYAQGVELPEHYSGPVPADCELIDLPPCKMMVFQSQPYDDADFEEAIGEVWDAIKDYNPETYGFRWADEDGPRFQMEPQGYRGYIEGRPVREITKIGNT